MARISVILLFLVAGCHSNEAPAELPDHPYDEQVIARLPVYDSLVHELLAYYPLLQKPNENETYSMYKLSTDSNVLYGRLPLQGANKVRQYFTQLGDDFIFGFQLYKDSSIKIFIRDSYSGQYNLTISERLSFYPAGGNMRRREPPIKDSILNRNWQYWISFDERWLF